MKPITVIPSSSARSIASDEGADTAASIGMPAIDAFCVSSKLARPETCRHHAAQREQSLAVRPADDLVDGVVAADVFPQHEHLAGATVEERSGVQSAGLVEDILTRPQPIGKSREQFGVDHEVVVGDGVVGCRAHRVDARLAAQSARRGHVEVALEARIGGGDAFRESHVEHVERVLTLVVHARAVPDRGDLTRVGDDAFGDQESGRPDRSHVRGCAS